MLTAVAAGNVIMAKALLEHHAGALSSTGFEPSIAQHKCHSCLSGGSVHACCIVWRRGRGGNGMRIRVRRLEPVDGCRKCAPGAPTKWL